MTVYSQNLTVHFCGNAHGKVNEVLPRSDTHILWEAHKRYLEVCLELQPLPGFIFDIIYKFAALKVLPIDYKWCFHSSNLSLSPMANFNTQFLLPSCVLFFCSTWMHIEISRVTLSDPWLIHWCQLASRLHSVLLRCSCDSFLHSILRLYVVFYNLDIWIFRSATYAASLTLMLIKRLHVRTT